MNINRVREPFPQPGRRDYFAVIADIIGLVPPECVALKAALESARSSAAFRAPEVRILDWRHLSEVLDAALGDVPDEQLLDWQLQIRNIITAKGTPWEIKE